MDFFEIFEDELTEEVIVKWKENGTDYSLIKGMFGDISIEPHTSMYSTDYFDLQDVIFLLFCKTTILEASILIIDGVIEYLDEAHDTISKERKNQAIKNIRTFYPEFTFDK